jgi:hypothetical protein
MSATDLERMNDRIERLERKLRRRTRLLIACVILAALASLLIGQTPSKRTLEAEKFILRGPQGQELATLDAEGTGALLLLYDSQHRPRVSLVSSDGESGAAIMGTDLKSAASIEVNAKNRPVVELQDEQGRTRADFAITDQGPAMRMWDSNSNMRAAVAIHNEVPMVTVSAGSDPRKGSVVIGAGAGDWGVSKGGHILITGPDGKARDVMK